MRRTRTNHICGVALIIVLAFVVILTGLAVAFFSRATTDRQISFSSASQTDAELLARGALAVTLGDLKQEIAAGSTQSTVSGVTIYSPKSTASPAAIVPALAGSTGTGGLENLVKRSAAGVTFYSGSNYDTTNYPPANRPAGPSTQSSTTIPSLNNRSISTTRWNKPLLITKKTTTSTAITPVAAFTAPDWILVARDGSNPPSWNNNMVSSSSNTTSVIGRYAYAVYDEGALIDMNVAAYPTVSATAQVGRKGPISYADLTQIPGISSLTTGATGSQTKLVNGIVGWRNFASAQATGSLGTFQSGNTYSFASGTNYYNAILTNSNGFIAVSNTNLNGGLSDRKLASRQQLISLLTRGMASTSSDTANLQVALQYFGTFSRELNRPSWSPSYNATDFGGLSTYAYKTNADSSSAINRNLPNVRVITGGFARADGTTAVAGESLIKERFPLTRINGLGLTGIVTSVNSTLKNGVLSPADVSTVQRDFGLQWDGVNNHWLYVGASGSTIQSRIKRLDEVASENREPNFFEILKAVILNGSVGLGSGSANTFVQAEAKYYSTANGFSADHQIMQIGANIIDAWDTDNIPTFIAFTDPTTSTIYEIAGIENLPYLNKLVFDFWVSKNGNGGAHDQMYSWLVPSLWNPHQNAVAAPTPGSTPTPTPTPTATPTPTPTPPPNPAPDVRFAMTSGSVHSVITFSDVSPIPSSGAPSPSPTVYPYMEVRANGFATACPPVPTPASSPAPANENGLSPHGGNVSPTNPPRDPIGVYNGIDLGNPTDLFRNNAYKKVVQVYPIFTPGTNFEMQVNINGTWKTYQAWKNCNNGTDPPGSPLVANQGGSYGNSSFQDPEFISLDPRTVRFGVWASDAKTTGKPNDYIVGAEDTMDQNVPGLELVTALKPQPTSAPSPPYFPTTGKTYLYANNDSNNSAAAGDRYPDLDGVVRRGDWTTEKPTPTPGTTSKKSIMYASAAPLPTPNNSQDRPRVLSAPFQSVAELGHVFRDQPWKTLNFSNANSADGGLLDGFTLQDAPMVAGKTSLNTRQSAVLTAILSQVTRNLAAGQAVGSAAPDTGPTLTAADIKTIATDLAASTAAAPMINKAELVTRLMEDTTLNNLWKNPGNNDPYNKESREAIIRAFCDSTQTRTWNLMIDVIAQSGRYPPNAAALKDFVVEGEKRYWLHVAIDRFTGEVIDQQLEAVYE